MAKQKKTPPAEYETGSWSGQPQYTCNTCRFDTLDQKRMLEHLVEQHSSLAALETLFPGQPQQEPESITAGEPTSEIYEIEVEEVDDAQNNPG
jgi:hypothetical protein